MNLFVDFEAGNNANDGQSFANRVLTITGGITSSKTAPGDIIRIMKSESPVSIGDALWTNKSATVTLASALTKTGYLDGAWTASANVTGTTSTTRKEGSNSASLAIASAFTTGLAGYYDMGSSQDFSGFDSICVWIRSSGTHAAGVFRIIGSSDATGTTVVESFTINEPLSANQWKPLFLPKGSALSATIRSWGLECVSDPGTVTVLIDNLLGCNANSIDLTTVITKSSSETNLEYYTIKSINGTTVLLDNEANSAATATPRGYYGTTETVTTYKVRPIRISSIQTVQEAGTAAAMSIYSGGWDRTDMSTQTGVTLLDTGDVNLATFVSSLGHIQFEKIVCVRGQRAFSLTGGSNFILTNVGATGCVGSGSSVIFAGVSSAYLYQCRVNHCATTGISVGSANRAVIKSCVSSSNTSIGINVATATDVVLLDCETNNNNSSGIDASSNFYANNHTAKDNGSFGIVISAATGIVVAPTTSGNGSGGLTTANGGILKVDDTTNCTDSTVYNSTTGGRIQVSRLNGDPLDRRVRHLGAWVIQTDQVTVHSPATISYKHTPQSGSHMANVPLVQETKPFAVSSTGTLTVSIHARRDHATNVGGRLVVRGLQVDGIPTTLTDDISVGADTWEQLSVSGSPSEDVPIVVELHSWTTVGTSTNNVFFSDASVTQP